MRTLIFTLLLVSISEVSYGQLVTSEFTKLGPKPKGRIVQSTDSNLQDIGFKDAAIPLKKFQDTYAHLSSEAFQLKLQGALSAGPLMFFRSYVNTYYSDLSDNNNSPNLVLCLGDAHPENFGFMGFRNDVRLVFNDLDDSGVCPIEYDIIRYFTAADLAFNDKALIKDLIQEYVSVVNRKKSPEGLPANSYPDLQKKRKKILAKNTDGKNFLSSDEILPVKSSLKKAILAEISKIPLLSSLRILDVAEVLRDTGGSGGLKRYWLLVEGANGQDILELKEMSKPGTWYGAWKQPQWTQAERVEQVKKYVWGDSPDFYHGVPFQGKTFLVRSRTRESVTLKDLSPKDLRQYLLIQAGLLATYHKTFIKAEAPNLKDWIEKNLPGLKERYSNTYKVLNN